MPSTQPLACGVIVFSQRMDMKRRELKELTDAWGTGEAVLENLQKLLQVASHLSRAVRAPSFTDSELDHLDLLARDVVCRFYSGVLCRIFVPSV